MKLQTSRLSLGHHFMILTHFSQEYYFKVKIKN